MAVIATDDAYNARNFVIRAFTKIDISGRENDVGNVVFVNFTVAIVIGDIDRNRRVQDLVIVRICRWFSAGKVYRPVPLEIRLKLSCRRQNDTEIGVFLNGNTGFRRFLAELVISTVIDTGAGLTARQTFVVNAGLFTIATEFLIDSATRAKTLRLAFAAFADLSGFATNTITIRI